MSLHNTTRRFVITLSLVLGFSVGLPSPSGHSSEILQEVPIGKGVFLLANPEMRDPHFFHSVILLIQYGADGASGLIINKPTRTFPKEAIPDLEGAGKLSHPVLIGGPVQQDRVLSLLHGKNPPGGTEKVLNDVYLSISKKTLSKALEGKDPDKTIRLYAGYAGWTAGQLEREIGLGTWQVIRPDADMIFADDPSKVWPALLHRERELMVEDRHLYSHFPVL
ncbi:MAG: YqgE/AlgH family protein [Nitrospirae bacterium]|nr:YqgE/AlgH family protein [Nitrospirota bacterium]